MALALAAPAAFAGQLNTSGMVATGKYDRFLIRCSDGTPAQRNAAARKLALDPAGRAHGVDVGHMRERAVAAGVIRTARKLNKAAAEALMRRLAKHPSVMYVELDKINTIVMTPNDPGYAQQWGYNDS